METVSPTNVTAAFIRFLVVVGRALTHAALIFALLLPSQEGMWYGLAQWFGVAEDRIADVVPNAANFPDTALHSQEELFN